MKPRTEPLVVAAATLLSLTVASPGVAKTPFVHETVASAGFVGLNTSMALDANDDPHIVYWDLTNQMLIYACREDNTWSFDVVEAAAFLGEETSIDIDSQGRPHVSFHKYTGATEELRYAVLSGGVWNVVTPDATANAHGRYNAIAVDNSDRPHISYYDVTDGDLRYAVKDGAWASEVVQSTGDTGLYTDIAANDQGDPYIIFVDLGADDVVSIYKHAGTWRTRTVDVDLGTKTATAIALDASGFPHFVWRLGSEIFYSFDDGIIGINNYEEQLPSSFAMSTLALSLALDTEDRPHVAFYEIVALQLGYATKNPTWTTERVEVDLTVGKFPSIALDRYNNPKIAYHDEPAGGVKFTDSAIRLTSLLDGVTWPVGSERTVVWRGAGDIDIFLSTNGGATYNLIAASVNGGGATSGGEYTFTVPHTPSRFCKIKLERQSPYSVDLGDSLFTIETDVALLSFVVTLDPGGGNILSWRTDPGPQDLAGYRVERNRGETRWEDVVALTSETSYRDTEGRVDDAYRLYAVNGLGGVTLLGESRPDGAIPPADPLNIWPNPFRDGVLTIVYGTVGGIAGGTGDATVAVYDVAGRLVRTVVDERVPAGRYSAMWDGRNSGGGLAPAGVYFVKLSSGAVATTRKLVIVR